MSLPHRLALTFLVALAVSAPVTADAQSTAARYPCRDVHTFDFWEGTFDATPWNDPSAAPSGQLRNTREYDGCVFVERWTSPQGNGMSMVFYDIARKTWRMIWNDDNNQSSAFDAGEFHDGTMRFTGWVLSPKGDRVMAANVLQNVSPGVIRHIFSISRDSGKTWTVVGDGRFARRKASSSP